MTKIDFKKQNKGWYRPSTNVIEIVDIPDLPFLMIDGKHYSQKSATFQPAIEALFGMAYTMRFLFKNEVHKPEGYYEYVIPPLEGLWWMHSGNPHFDAEQWEDWRWTLMIRQPEFFDADMIEEAREILRKKKNPSELPNLRYERYAEGKSVQTMHIGPYHEEGPTIQKMHDFVAEKGLELHGKHHEIYIGDVRRAAPERLKTVLRHPVR